MVRDRDRLIIDDVDERTGRVTLLWPDSATSFRDRLATFAAVSYEHLYQRGH